MGSTLPQVEELQSHSTGPFSSHSDDLLTERLWEHFLVLKHHFASEFPLVLSLASLLQQRLQVYAQRACPQTQGHFGLLKRELRRNEPIAKTY